MGQLGSTLPNFEEIGQLFQFESTNFADPLWYERQTRYVTYNGCLTAEKCLAI